MKVLPHSEESERAFLGAWLLAGEMDHSDLKPSHFYSPRNRGVFQACSHIQASNQPVDLVTVATYLRDSNKLQSGDLAVISKYTNEVPSIQYAQKYAKIIVEMARRRAIILAAMELGDAVANLPGSIADDGAELDAKLMRFDQSITGFTTGKDEAVSIRDELMAAHDHLEAVTMGKVQPNIPLGFHVLDNNYPLCKGDLFVVGGRPGMGKTALAISIAIRAAQKGTKVLFVTTEMSTRQLIYRMLTQLTGIQTREFRTGQMTNPEKAWEKIGAATTKLHVLPIYFVHRGSMTASQVVNYVAKTKRKHSIDIAILDHLHRLTVKGELRESLGEAIRSFKSCAIDNDVGFICLAQLNRGVESRTPPIPEPRDLRETGTIEEEADTIIFPYRQDHYADSGFFGDVNSSDPKAVKIRKDKGFVEDYSGVVILIGGKNRHDRITPARMGWSGDRMAFTDAEERWDV